jgi:outer membrane scaffolding protein for murein synthesis (MipA/OmpV family)
VYDEQDFELGYSNAVGKLEYQFLLWGYFYFNQIETPNTGEIYYKLQYPVWKNTKIFTENVVDIGAYKGAFYNSTGLFYEKELDKLTIEYKLFTGFGSAKFNNAYFGTDKAALNFAGTSLNLEYTFKNNFYVAAKGEYNQYTDKEIRLSTGLNNTSNISVYFGLNF